MFDLPADESVQSPRIHHQLIPEEAQNEFRFDQNVVEGLSQKLHQFSPRESTAIVQGNFSINSWNLPDISYTMVGFSKEKYNVNPMDDLGQYWGSIIMHGETCQTLVPYNYVSQLLTQKPLFLMFRVSRVLPEI